MYYRREHLYGQSINTDQSRGLPWISNYQLKVINHRRLKNGIWIYFLLLIFEGALRKWVLPSLTTPLLLIRDPLAIWLIFEAFRRGVFRPNGYVLAMTLVSLVGFIMALLTGHGNLLVAVYGLRITLLHFPLIFLIGQLWSHTEVLRLGYWLLWIGICMTLLVAVQFYSPQTAWVNRGIGNDLTGSGFSGAAGYYRVPGTFSFTNGLSAFYGLMAAYLFYFWLDGRDKVPRLLLLTATVALLTAIPLSISRTLLFEVALSFAFIIPLAWRRLRLISYTLGAMLVGGSILLVLGSFGFFQIAVQAFSERFTMASQVEGGLEGTLVDRFLGGMIGAITDADVHFWGLGLGMGTNAGSQLMTGKRMFLIAEVEWGRLIGEMGILLGFVMILIRCLVTGNLMLRGWHAAVRGNLLPWFLLSFAALSILQGQWAQPTSLGFAVLSGGLVVAAQKKIRKGTLKHKANKC